MGVSLLGVGTGTGSVRCGCYVITTRAFHAALVPMKEAGNTLDDFPAEAFTILIFCDAF
jgi:hypothetical protein